MEGQVRTFPDFSERHLGTGHFRSESEKVGSNYRGLSNSKSLANNLESKESPYMTQKYSLPILPSLLGQRKLVEKREWPQAPVGAVGRGKEGSAFPHFVPRCELSLKAA
jgi:hypothetical protein